MYVMERECVRESCEVRVRFCKSIFSEVERELRLTPQAHAHAHAHAQHARTHARTHARNTSMQHTHAVPGRTLLEGDAVCNVHVRGRGYRWSSAPHSCKVDYHRVGS